MKMIKVNGDQLNWTPGMTVADVLKAKNYVFPLLVVTVDGLHVKPSDYCDVVVHDEALVQVIHLISGG
jgi:sulfur carrier protein